MAQALDFGKIKDSCSSLTGLAGDIGSTVEAIDSAVGKIQNPAWEGEASEAYRDKLKTLAAHLPEANRQLAEAVIFLASCADAYDQLSNDAVKKLKDLIGGQDYIDKYDVDKAPDVNLDSRYGEEDSNTNTDTDTTGTTDTSGTPRSSGCSSSGCGSSGCGSKGCGSSGCSSGTPVTPSTPETVPETTPEPVDLTGKIKEIEYSAIDLNKAEADTKKIFEDKDFKYVGGYAMLGEAYLIACDASIGKIGDVIQFTLDDGTVVKCIVAANTTDASDKENISFIIEKDKLEEAKKKEIIKKLLSKSKKIENTGPYEGFTSETPAGPVTGENITNGNILVTSKPVGTGTKYSISDNDLAYLAYVAKREQGSIEGAKLELSLMLNLYEKNKSKYSSVVDYVKNSGWFGSSNAYSYPGADYVNVAKDVISDGNRYLTSNVVEHDCLSDITSISTGSVGDRNNYVPGKTVIKNRYGATYMFVGFAPNGGDPFGYLV